MQPDGSGDHCFKIFDELQRRKFGVSVGFVCVQGQRRGPESAEPGVSVLSGPLRCNKPSRVAIGLPTGSKMFASVVRRPSLNLNSRIDRCYQRSTGPDGTGTFTARRTPVRLPVTGPSSAMIRRMQSNSSRVRAD